MPGLVPTFAKASADWHRARRSLGVDGCRASTAYDALRSPQRGANNPEPFRRPRTGKTDDSSAQPVSRLLKRTSRHRNRASYFARMARRRHRANTQCLLTGFGRLSRQTASPSPTRPSVAERGHHAGIGRCMASGCSWSRKGRAAATSDGWDRGCRLVGRLEIVGDRQRLSRQGLRVRGRECLNRLGLRAFRARPDHTCIDRENVASQKVARRLGAIIEASSTCCHVADVW